MVGRAYTIAFSIVFAFGSFSCFSPDRAESLSCSAEGLCPGVQVCDFDNVCRDTYTRDGNMADAGSLDAFLAQDSGAIDSNVSPLLDAANVNNNIIPTGPTAVTTPIGSPGSGTSFGSIGCGSGEIMYGIEGRVENQSFPNGFCEFKARCGHLKTIDGTVILLKDGDSVPTGVGIPICKTGNIVVGLDCPDNTVVSGWTGTRQAPGPFRIVSLSLQCTEISSQAALLGTQNVGPVGLSLTDSPPPQTAICGSDKVAFGFRGTAGAVVDSYELRCRALTTEEL